MSTIAAVAHPVSFSKRWLALWGAGALGALTILPYVLYVQADALELAVTESGLPMAILLALTGMQTAIMVGVATVLGLWAGRAAGLRTPVLDALLAGRAPSWGWLPLAAALGLGSALVMVGLDLAMAPLMPPQVLEGMNAATPPAWAGLLTLLYGGITEELLLRVFFMGVLVWLGSRVLRREGGVDPVVAWAAILTAALVFGAGHLPTMAGIAPLSGVVVLRVLALNAIIGVACGWLYWRRGLVAAMVAHALVDLVLHVIIPLAAG